MKYAFNQNMMTTGFLADGPRDFAQKYGGRWFATAYEAGDVALHKAHAVRTIQYLPDKKDEGLLILTLGADPRVDHQQRPRQPHQAGHRLALRGFLAAVGHAVEQAF